MIASLAVELTAQLSQGDDFGGFPPPQPKHPHVSGSSMSGSGLGCVETADDFRLDLRDADIWANERLCPDLGSDRLRVGGNWGLGCAGEFKLRV